jgi:2'-5' RNA ligase
MRTFIAIELPQEIKDALGRLQGQLKASGADVKWVAPNNIHLTLKFLGEIDDSQLDGVKRIIEDVAKSQSCFSIHLSSLGAFPKINFPRVIWVGFSEGDTETKEIAKELEERIAKVGIPKETRPFSSHITIGRVRSALNREKLIQSLQAIANDFDRQSLFCIVTKVTLFKSTLTPQGPIYEILKEANLKTS